jgi:hypothetical protein
MATDPEAQTQIARLLQDEGLRTASREAVRTAVDTAFEALVAGIVAEAAASDDVVDRESGLSFLQLRLQSLASVLDEAQASRLLEAARERMEAW